MCYTLQRDKALTLNVLNSKMNGQHISITRYQKTRYWAIWNEVDLLAVTVYRKGAEAILNFITNTNTNNENTNTMTSQTGHPTNCTPDRAP